MKPRTHRNATLSALLVLLAISLAANLLLYREASWPLFDESDPLIERTLAHFARQERTGLRDIRRQSFPIVMSLRDRTCVELRRYDRLGHSSACYDRRGRLIEETQSVVN